MIKVADIQQEVNLSLKQVATPEMIDQLVGDLAAAGYAEWQRLGAKELAESSFRLDYLNAIHEPELSPGQAVVALVGELPNMLEHGAPAQDMRDFLLDPGRVPVKEPGAGGRGMYETEDGDFYRAIPFRHTTPGSKEAPRGKATGLEMGKAYSKEAAVGNWKRMGAEVYAQAKALTAYRDAYAPLEDKKLPAGVGGAYALRNPTTGTAHKSDIYEGMIREEHTYSEGGPAQSQYITFRTISTAVNDGSWIRKPFPARHLAEKVARFIERLAPELIAALLEGS